MTKEQEEAIGIISKYLNFNEICGTRNFKEAIETVLSMLKEKDREIESLEKTLDKRFIYVTGARTIYARLMQLDKETIVQDDLKRRNELNQCIKAKEKYKDLYNKALSDLVKAEHKNIKQDKIIDLMAEYIANRDNDEDICTHQIAEWCEDEEYGVLVEVCRKCIKQYFERKCEE